MIDLAAVDDFVLSLLGIYKFQVFTVGMDHQAGMGIEGNHNGFPAAPHGFFLHLRKDLLMPEVNAVERPDTYHGIGYRLKKIYAVVYPHLRLMY